MDFATLYFWLSQYVDPAMAAMIATWWAFRAHLGI